MIITSGDAVYKMDYNKVLEYHIAKMADITVVCRELERGEDASRFGVLKMNDSMRIEEFEKTYGGKWKYYLNGNLCNQKTPVDRDD